MPCPLKYTWLGGFLLATLAGASTMGDTARQEHPPAKNPGILAGSAPFPIAPDCRRAGQLLQRQATCAFGKSVYLVAWSDGHRQIERPAADLYCARLERGTGKSLDPAGIRICAAADLQEYPALAFDGTNFLVVWQDLRNGKDYDLYAARVTEQGKVLDPDGFLVCQSQANQARPAVGFASGNFWVTWMDGRHYPVYGLYAARISPPGQVLDPEGRVLDQEDPQRTAQARPPTHSWLGDKHYWWDRLASRFLPSLAVKGDQCLVVYLREQHANKTVGQALVLDTSSGALVHGPVKLSGEPRDRLAACATPAGWVVAFDQWMSGWSPAARLAALRLAPDLHPQDAITEGAPKPGPLPESPMLDLQKLLADGGATHQQGKGHFSFWQAAAVWNGRQVVVAMDYGWRTKNRPTELHYAVVATRLDIATGQFLDPSPLILANASGVSGSSVANPVLAAGPAGEVLLVYEFDEGLDRLTLLGRLLRTD